MSSRAMYSRKSEMQLLPTRNWCTQAPVRRRANFSAAPDRLLLTINYIFLRLWTFSGRLCHNVITWFLRLNCYSLHFSKKDFKKICWWESEVPCVASKQIFHASMSKCSFPQMLVFNARKLLNIVPTWNSRGENRGKHFSFFLIPIKSWWCAWCHNFQFHLAHVSWLRKSNKLWLQIENDNKEKTYDIRSFFSIVDVHFLSEE